MPRKNPGSSSENVISGTSGSDFLSGEGGSFILSGGRGDDTYWVDDSGDSVEEKKRGGTDTVRASIDYTLSDNVENLTLVEGSGALNGTGNSEDNIIIGNAADNRLDGLSGDDTLIGGDGDDILIGGGGSDTISGGNGTDVAVFSGLFSDYLIEGTADALYITHQPTGTTDLLDGVEILKFEDGTYTVAELLAPAAPAAADDAVTTNEDTPVDILVLENDSQGLVVESVTNGSMGSVTINADGTLSYTPDQDANGQDTFTYTAVDESGQKTTATVSVQITAVNDAPIALDDTLTVSADTLSSGSASLLDNDTDIDGDTLSVTGIGATADAIQNFTPSDTSLTLTTTAGGTIEVFRDGSYSYTPPSGFTGTDSIVYVAEDDFGATATAILTIDVQDTGGSTPPPSGTEPTPYYVEGLVFGDPYRLNAGNDMGAPITVTYAFLEATPDYYSSSSTFFSTFESYTLEQQIATREILAEIESFTNISFVETGADLATITFGLADLNGFMGLAYRPEGTETQTLASDVWINAAYAAIGFGDGSGALTTLMHEIGHAIGLDHATLPDAEENQQYTVMASASNPTFLSSPSSYQLYDIASLQYLYGTNDMYASGDDVYTFADLADVTKVIWDAGGNDTIDLSDAEYGVQIDLDAGAFSSVASFGGNNLAIALGTVIEDVTGGAFDDVISGNDAANRINGGAGDDVISGGAGADVFEFSANWGNDTVLDFDTQTDVLDLSQVGAAFRDIDITYADGNAIVQFQDDSIVLVGVDALDPGMFVFV